MYVTADEVRVFSRLGYENLEYDTETEFETYINSLIPLAQSIVDQFCNVPTDFFADGSYSETSGLYDYRETWIHLRLITEKLDLGQKKKKGRFGGYNEL